MANPCVVILLVAVTCRAVASNDNDVLELKQQVNDIKENNQLFKMAMQEMAAMIENATLAMDETGDEASNDVDDVNQEASQQIPTLDPNEEVVLKRLDLVTQEIALIENYMTDEKSTDKVLGDLQGVTGQSFDETMAEIKQMAMDMVDEVKLKLEPVDQSLTKVETRVNDRNVAIGGVLYYTEVGSACGRGDGVCGTDLSECREGKCQCLPGLSSDALQQTCTATCRLGYGSTYQITSNYVIRGFNKEVLEHVTKVQECKDRCEAAEGYVCRSLDYFPAWRRCYLSDVVKGDDIDAAHAGDEYLDAAEDEYGDVGDVVNGEDAPVGWEYNDAGVHYQRDCVVDTTNTTP